MSDESWSDKNKIDEALAAWPDIQAADDEALAAKTMNRIRANFPPKSKLSLTDDALVSLPFPRTPEDQELSEPDAADDTAKHVAQPAVAAPIARAVAEAPFVAEDATREIVRSDAERTQEIRQPREKSSQIDVPNRRVSSIPPPSSGVARSEKSPAGLAGRETSQKKAEASMGQVERQRDRTSFKDLAKLAATPSPASVRPASAKVPVASPSSPSGLKSDSGVVDLQAAALSDPQGAERAKSTPLASGSLFDDEAPNSQRASVAPPSLSGEHLGPPSGPLSAVSSVPQQIDPYSPASVRPSMPSSAPSAGRISVVPVSAGPHSAVAAMAQPEAKKESKSRAGILLGSLVGVGAIAAGAVFFVRSHHAPVAEPDTHVAATNPQPNAVQPAATSVTAQNNPATPAASDAVSPDALTVAAADDNGGAKSGTKPVAKKASGKPSVALKDAIAKTEVDTPSAPADVKTPPVVAAKDEAPPAVGGSASLQDAMKTAAGPSDSTNAQAAPTGPKFAPGSVPQRPSQGALSSAIGRSLPDARACLGPDDGVSYANVVFESSGGVQSVTLSGFASGKPAGACIITALKKATVGPFAESTYSAKVTVRP